jgi:hypothetical protein
MAMTIRDVRVTKVFYPILLDLARERRTTTYGALVDEAQARNPDDDIIAALIPRAVGRRLLVLRGFTDELGYPDLSSLVLNASTGEVGDAYSDKFDPRDKRAEVMAFDWTGVVPEFDAFVDRYEREIASRNRPKRSREEAKHLLWDYAKDNPKALLPSPPQREAVLSSLIAGEDVADAIAEVMGN